MIYLNKQTKYLVLVLLLLTVNFFSQETIIESTQSENYGEDNFGQYFSVSNNKIVVSATSSITSRGSTGAVYVYRLEGETWIFEEKIYPNDGVDGDGFGFQVEIYNNVLIVTSLKYNDVGAIYVYQFNGTNWVFEQKITLSNPISGDDFGYRISLLDESTFFASTFEDDQVNKSHLYEFKRINGIWTEAQKISTSSNSSRGFVVDSNTDYLFLSDRGYSNSNSYSGRVYVFIKQNDIWVEDQILIPDSGRTGGSGFGYDLEMDNNYLVVSSWNHDAFLYERNISSGKYDFVTKIDKPLSNPTRFGSSISIKGDYIIVGSGENIAYLYEKEGNNWVEKLTLTPQSTVDIEYGFWDVSLDSERAYVGAIHQDANNDFDEDNGGVYVYDISTVLNVDNNIKTEFKAFPNPIKDILSFKSGNTIISKKEVFDLTGKLVLKENNSKKSLNLSNLKEGIYIVKISTEFGRVFIKKIIKK